MENEIYKILKKHKLPLKKREEVLTDLLLLFSVVGRSEQLKCEHKGRRTATELVEYCEDCKKILFHP